MTVACPNCATQLSNDFEVAGKEVECPSCGVRFIMPPLVAATPPVQRSRPHGPFRLSRPAIYVGIAAAVLLLVLVGALSLTSVITSVASSVTDPDLAAVRQYLRENTPTGKWEEIRWWPARKVGGGSKYWSEHRICRLKFRTENPFGGRAVMDQVFIFNPDDNHVSLAHDGFQLTRASDFPD